MKQKKILLLCGTHNDLGLIRSLRKLGVYLIQTGSIPNLVGEKFVDEYIQADYSDKELILQIAMEKQVDGICQCCNDYGVYTAAYVAEKLGFSGYDSQKTTLLLHNKEKFRALAQELSLPIPRFAPCTSKEAAQNCDFSYPLMVKPSDASAGNGVLKVEQDKDFLQAIQNAFDISRNKTILIEEYIEGTQHGFCTFLRNQKVVATCSNNEYSILNPYRVELDTFPASNIGLVKESLIQAVETIAQKLQLCDGIFHLQYIMRENKAYIIEVMRRVLGNMYSVPANKLTNLDWDYWETRAKLGYSLEKFPQHTEEEGFFAYKAVLAPCNGVIDTMEIPVAYQPFLLDSFLLKGKGEEITRYDAQPVALLFFQFSCEKEMKGLLIDQYRNDLVKMSS